MIAGGGYGRRLVSGLFGLFLIFSGLACQDLLGDTDRIELGPTETRDDSFAVGPTADLRVSTF